MYPRPAPPQAGGRAITGSTLRLRSALVALAILAGSGGEAFPQASRVALGSTPETPWTCPVSHPIKGNFTTHSGEPCIYHLPGGRFYADTKPERCYATWAEAVRDGCRRSKR